MPSLIPRPIPRFSMLHAFTWNAPGDKRLGYSIMHKTINDHKRMNTRHNTFEPPYDLFLTSMHYL